MSSLQEPKLSVPWSRGQRETGLSSFSLSSTVLDLNGANGVHFRSHKINFLDEAREGHFRSCPEHLHQHTVGRGHFLGVFLRKPTYASQFLWTHGVIIPATDSEAGSRALPGGGGCRESSQSSGGRWVEGSQVGQNGDHLKTPGDPQSMTNSTAQPPGDCKYQLLREASQNLEQFLKKWSLTFQALSEAQPRECCQNPQASFQPWVLLWGSLIKAK